MIIQVGRHNEPGAEYIGRRMTGWRRASPLANPFIMRNRSDDERNRVCDEYERWIAQQIEAGNEAVTAELDRLTALADTQDYLILGCFCSPNRCHGDTIKRIIDDRLKAK